MLHAYAFINNYTTSYVYFTMLDGAMSVSTSMVPGRNGGVIKSIVEVFATVLRTVDLNLGCDRSVK